MVTTSPLVTGVFAAGDCLVTAPCGWVLLAAAGCSFSEIPLACAQAWTADCCCPTKFGSGGPALTTMATGLFCGQEVFAPGLVLITTPTAMVADTWLVTLPGVSPACLSADWALASGWPLTCGTEIIFGPADGNSSTVLPLRTRLDAPGVVATTSPLAMLLSTLAGPVVTLKPMFRSSVRAELTLSPVTLGTWAYRPASCHQPRPATSASTTITTIT